MPSRSSRNIWPQKKNGGGEGAAAHVFGWVYLNMFLCDPGSDCGETGPPVNVCQAEIGKTALRLPYLDRGGVV